jgi:hypothetical protein
MEEVDEDLISDIVYSICNAVSEVSGRSGMAFISMVGKNLLSTVEEKKNLPSNKEYMIASLNDFLEFFVALGYASSIKASMENNALRLEFKDIRFIESEKLLQNEKSAVLPLYITFASRAFLEKYFNMSLVYGDYGITDMSSTAAYLRILLIAKSCWSTLVDS